jgi:hypothetical protein
MSSSDNAREQARRNVVLARINLQLAKGWTHVSPSERAAEVEACNERLNQALTEMQIADR